MLQKSNVVKCPTCGNVKRTRGKKFFQCCGVYHNIIENTPQYWSNKTVFEHDKITKGVKQMNISKTIDEPNEETIFYQNIRNYLKNIKI